MSNNNLKQLARRKWPATYDTKTGNWYTGYDGYISTKQTPEYVKDEKGEFVREEWIDERGDVRYKLKTVLSEKPKHFQTERHEVRKLTLRYDRYTRGRSAANFILVDPYGYTYETSCSGFDEFLKAIFSNLVYSDIGYYTDSDGQAKKTTWFTANFVQAKQGGNIFIEYFGEAE